MSKPGDYTVLWICALTTEYVAAQTFLDEEDSKPEAGTIPISDTNTYTLGRIAGHKVVLAVLPKGEYGVGSAASVITNILRSFPNIRIGLMVGVGGGAPTRANDIRLGDVVVSSPKDGYGGIYHYDLGKEVQDSGFKQSGFLNQPPTVVRTAVSALEAKHIRKGHHIAQNIEIALELNPRLRRRGYAGPALKSDRLYKIDIVHPALAENCEDTCGTESHKLVARRPRDEEDDNPAIHYGLIGSGNKVIKDATLRDKLAREQGVLCFEMEAAGIMNRMPCLVVRGICDYCDSHKNKDWQEYAAMTAAAYTKELLMEIPCKEIEREERLAAAIDQLTNDVHIVFASLEQMESSDKTRAIIKWLKAADPSVNYNTAIQAHHPGTGAWFLGSTQFQRWKERPSSFLWLHGLSGCGKTILSAAIIQHLRDEHNSPTIYFYFDFSDPKKQHFEDMLRSLLLQLYHESLAARSIIDVLFESHSNGTRQSSRKQMEDTLELILEESDGTTIILDALDEGQSPSELVQWCRAIDSLKALKVRLLVTSRTQVVDLPDGNHVVSLGLESVSGDIKYYTRRRLCSGEFADWADQQPLRDEVETTVGEKAGGMFRWAALQLDTLRKCRNKPAIERALRDLPRTLNDTYTRMLCSIQATPYQREVTIILQMLLWSNQRLTLEACNDAVIVQPDRNPAFSVDDRFFDPLDVVKICSGLVTTVWSNTDFINFQYLQLAHASVREYLSSQEVIQPFQSHLREEDAWVYLIRLCHAYLCCIDWSTMDNQPDEFDQTFPLADWAVSAWPKHARYLEAFDDDVLASVLDFLQRACLVSEHLFRYSITQFYWADRTQCYPLYFAALMGFRRSCKRLIGSGSPDMPEESDESRGYVQRYSRLTELGVRPAVIQEDLDASLLAASARGYDIIVQDLLGRGARPDASRIQNYSDEYTALQLASRLGHTKVVQLLLESGASVNYNAKPLYKTPLYEASESGNVDVVDVLLAHKADPDLRSNGESPLRVAVLNGHVAVAQALISAGADRSNHFVHRFVKPSHERPGVVYYRGSDGKLIDTLLKLAVSRDDDNMVQLLLDNGFSTDDANVHAETVLHLAALWCEHTTIRMLLERGARIDTQGPEGTALAVASRSGRSHAVQILLNYGADLSGCRWHDPILAAAQKGHFGIVEQILVHDVHINELCYLGTALYRAAWQNSETLVKILLKHGAVADYHEESTRTPLQIATAGGHLEVMRLLIEGGASADQDGWPDFPPLHDPRVAFSRITTDRAWLRWLQTHPGSTLRQAGQRGPREAAELLSRALNPLQIAIIEGSPKAVELLLHCGADVNKGQWYTPLQIAVSLGHQDIVKKLLGSGAYLNISDPNATLLELAFRQNHEETVRLLVEHGAAVGGDDPLQLAALYGHVRTMQVLLAGRIIGNMDPPLAPRADFITERQLGSTLNIAVFADTYGYGRVEGYDHLGVVRLLLDQGFLNKCDWIPALHHVVEQGYTRYLHLFLEHGVDVNESYAYYWRANTADTPRFTSFKLLRVAAFHGHERTVRLLLHCGAEIDDSSQGNCALASAAAGKQEHMMQLLVKRDANIALAIQVAWGWTNSKKITRRLRRLQSSATSPPDHFPEWQEHEPLSLLDECYLQPPQEQAIFESRHGPSILVEDHDEIPSQVPIRSASSRRRSKISSTVSRLRSRLSRN